MATPRKSDLVKLLLIGDSNVGKSSLLLRFSDDTFTPSFVTTGVDFKLKTIRLETGQNITLQIWDTGQERFRSITPSFYRAVQAILLVYDCCDETSFISIRNWIKQIDEHADSKASKMLVGNKCDLGNQRKISPERGAALAKELNIDFIETSAKDNINVSEAFLGLVRHVKQNVFRVSTNGVSLSGGGDSNAG